MHGVILYSVLTDPDCNISVTFKRGVSGHMAVECLVLIFHLYVRIKGYSIKGTLLTFFCYCWKTAMFTLVFLSKTYCVYS